MISPWQEMALWSTMTEPLDAVFLFTGSAGYNLYHKNTKEIRKHCNGQLSHEKQNKLTQAPEAGRVQNDDTPLSHNMVHRWYELILALFLWPFEAGGSRWPNRIIYKSIYPYWFTNQYIQVTDNYVKIIEWTQLLERENETCEFWCADRRSSTSLEIRSCSLSEICQRFELSGLLCHKCARNLSSKNMVKSGVNIVIPRNYS